METDLEIKNKNISKLENDILHLTSDRETMVAALQRDLESAHTTQDMLQKQVEFSNQSELII